MGIQEAVRLVGFDPDGQYRLIGCRCGAGCERAAYALGRDGRWRVVCMECGAESSGYETRNGAQMEWNFGRGEG